MDKLPTQQRHANMAAIRSKNTKPEMIVRRGLWKRGFRYRLNHKRLPGHPDLVLRKYRTCIFVNGCFWHGHKVMSDVRWKMEDNIESSECCKIPKTNREFWVAKIRRNKERDKEEQRKLAEMGTLNHIWLQDHQARVTAYPQLNEEDQQMPMAAEGDVV